MSVLIRVVRVVLLVILASIAVSLVLAIFRPETGAVEKLTLAVLVIVCVTVAAGVAALARRLRARLVER